MIDVNLFRKMEICSYALNWLQSSIKYILFYISSIPFSKKSRFTNMIFWLLERDRSIISRIIFLVDTTKMLLLRFSSAGLHIHFVVNCIVCNKWGESAPSGGRIFPIYYVATFFVNMNGCICVQLVRSPLLCI